MSIWDHLRRLGSKCFRCTWCILASKPCQFLSRFWWLLFISSSRKLQRPYGEWPTSFLHCRICTDFAHALNSCLQILINSAFPSLLCSLFDINTCFLSCWQQPKTSSNICKYFFLTNYLVTQQSLFLSKIPVFEILFDWWSTLHDHLRRTKDGLLAVLGKIWTYRYALIV